MNRIDVSSESASMTSSSSMVRPSRLSTTTRCSSGSIPTFAHLCADGVVVRREVEFVHDHVAAVVERREEGVDVDRGGVADDDFRLVGPDQRRESVAESLPVVEPVRVGVGPATDSEFLPLLDRVRQRPFRVRRKHAERVAVHVQFALRNRKSVPDGGERVGLVTSSRVVRTRIHTSRFGYDYFTVRSPARRSRFRRIERWRCRPESLPEPSFRVFLHEIEEVLGRRLEPPGVQYVVSGGQLAADTDARKEDREGKQPFVGVRFEENLPSPNVQYVGQSTAKPRLLSYLAMGRLGERLAGFVATPGTPHASGAFGWRIITTRSFESDIQTAAAPSHPFSAFRRPRSK